MSSRILITPKNFLIKNEEMDGGAVTFVGQTFFGFIILSFLRLAFNPRLLLLLLWCCCGSLERANHWVTNILSNLQYMIN